MTTTTLSPITLDGNTTALAEAKRTYLFPTRDLSFTDVVELTTRPSGSHRLKTADGRLHIVAKGWLAITIEDASHNWTV